MSAPSVHLRVIQGALGRAVEESAQAPSDQPIDRTDLVFSANGLLSQFFDGYSPREGQVALTRAIDEAITAGLSGDPQQFESSRLAGEAPTGTGKSIAYLAPAILQAVPRGQKVLVVTENNALTEQLVGKDLPTLATVLAAHLPRPLKFAALVGRGNFLCLDKVQNGDDDAQSAIYTDNPRLLRDLQALDAWARTTDTGNRNEITVTEAAWSARSTSSDDCKRDGCAHQRECFASKAKGESDNADVIVTNYALFFLSMKMRIENEGRESILPPCAVVILDEAHVAADKARDALGLEIGFGAVKKLTRWLKKQDAHTSANGQPGLVHTLSADIERGADALFERAASRVHDARGGKAALLSTDWHRTSGTEDTTPAPALLTDLARARTLARQIVERATGEDLTSEEKTARAQARNAYKRAHRLVRGICQATELYGSPDHLHWVEVERESERNKRTRITLRAADLDIGAVLREHLWQHRETRALIAVSATMTTGPASSGSSGWDFARRELGIPSATRTLSVPSPFDFARQALLVTPPGLPDPTAQARSGGRSDTEGAYARAAAEKLLETIHAANGRTLALFTSRKGLETAQEVLQAARRRGEMPYTLLVQDGSTPRRELMRVFMADTHSVLLGMQSFGTGIDPAGEACSAVFIDKFPFPPAGEPLMQGLIERAGGFTGGGFGKEYLPRAILTIKQWCGRAIRTKTDIAAVVVCDPRVRTKGYGAQMVAALGLPTRGGIEDIAGFLRGEGVPMGVRGGLFK